MKQGGEFDVVTAFRLHREIHHPEAALPPKKVQRHGHPNRPDPFGGRVRVAALADPAGLTESLRGASVLYNSYWVRFSHGRVTFDDAVANSKILIQAARDAGVRKIVHTSIANPSINSRLPYYAGKARGRGLIVDSGLPYAILRPIIIFGREDILINNIAWFARHFPVFAIPGSGEYQSAAHLRGGYGGSRGESCAGRGRPRARRRWPGDFQLQ